MVEDVVSPDLVEDYCRLFMNRRAYTVQSARPHRESGRHYYYRPKDAKGRQALALSRKTIAQHLEGKITIGLYAINPRTQRCKWVAIDADYENSLEHLVKLQWELTKDGIEAAIEKSRRGGHLWILAEAPLLAKDCRVYIYNLASKLKLPVKGTALPEGIEIFPRHNSLKPGEFGNAIRGPLGIHQANKKRYFFYGADYTLQAQMDYLKSLGNLNEERLKALIAGMTVPEELSEVHRRVPSFVPCRGSGNEFRILEHIQVRRKSGRNFWARCPSCALYGHDRNGDNLAVSVDDPRKYRCWAGCTREMIREALGHPVKRAVGGR
ncbi:MAG: hypothetical protein DMG06_13580 [Acidobacteria bacterium]|nr:MAG: hypothetical protein DMG06_13580 [Acidobacteriota bacterium]